ncbi:hypothetical protein Mal15_65920 [Stieleria maiorica]|uniref:Uncharacterized protein n=1 Tax=Stieleria maiorica TaxID=2795974 RepID=A0A5B9MQG6_9BACT|nr:hypothetical protein [Stieleria maiorica]QEG02471.1 hypothetical protein Mal15_65920 [Stieleria maiorica]
MRTRNPFARLVLAAMFAGAIVTAGQAQAKSDFDALLADVNFDSVPEVTPPAPLQDIAQPRATTLVDQNVQAIDEPVQATELTTAPAAEAMTLPQAAEKLPAPPAPLADDQPHDQVAAAAPIATVASCQSCNSGCGHHCQAAGHNCGHRYQPGSCQPYMPPQLPTSTFYQYWRSNACNVHVWDGFQNRCKPHIDLSIHGKSHGCCKSGCCNGACDNGGCAAAPVDCGPAPAEWSGGNAQ